MLQDAEILIYLGKNTGLYGTTTIKTTQLAKDLQTSQQSGSRKLQELENKNLITRNPAKDGFEVSLSDEGRKYLSTLKGSLHIIFSGNPTLEGKIITGLGEGRFYTNKEQYEKQFVEKIGIKPYPGTLNLQVDPKEANEFLAGKEEINIEGFTTKDRTYGELSAYKINLSGHKATLVLPARSSHPKNTVEIIADFSIREKLNLKDEDMVILK